MGNPPSILIHTSNKKGMCFRLEQCPYVWLQANKRKVKVNAILDAASNETSLNEQVAGVFGLSEPLENVKIHVLNVEVQWRHFSQCL